MSDPTGSARRGRLAEVLATRGGRAEPEAPFVIEHREALIYMLCQAAELEHGIMCQYLFAAFSLKQRGRRAHAGGTRSRHPLAAHDRPRRHRGDAAPRARAERALRDRRGAAPDPAEPARTRAPLSRGREPDTGALRRAGPPALHVPRAPGGHGARRGKGIDAPVHEAVP